MVQLHSTFSIISSFKLPRYVTQADTKPGCVLRQSNVVNLLQKERQLVSDEEMEACKISYNTWAYVGDINNKPQLNCVYQSDDAQNEFLSNPKIGLGEDVYDDEVAAAAQQACDVAPIAAADVPFEPPPPPSPLPSH